MPRRSTSTRPTRRSVSARALDSFAGGRIVIGIAGMPYKCPPAPLEVAFLIEAELRERGLRERSELHFCSPIGRAFTIESVSEMATPILEAKGIELHTFFNVETIDPARKVVQSLEGEELPYDLLVLVPPHKGAQFLIDSGLAPAPGGWLPTDRATLQVGGRPNVYALGDATDLPLSKAGSTAHFEAPVVTERIAAAVQRRAVEPRRGTYLGKVMCFFEIGDGKGTLLQFDYEHPPSPAEAEPAVAPGQDRLQQDVLAHRPEGSCLTPEGDDGRLSVIDPFARVARPEAAILGRPPGVAGLHNVEDYPDAETIPGIVVFRYDAPLCFANANDFKTRALDAVERQSERVEWLLLNAEAIVEIDLTAADALGELHDELERRGIVLAMARVKQDLRDQLERIGLITHIGADRLYSDAAGGGGGVRATV